MRFLATIGNLIILGFVVYLYAVHGAPKGDADVIALCILIAVPVVNLLALYTGFKTPELLTLELEARKAKLRKQIADANVTTAP